MANVSPQPAAQRMDHMSYREWAVRPPALLRNHLHGSDLYIRNQLCKSESTISLPPKFQRSLTPSPSNNDSDYFSTSSRGSAIIPSPPFAHTSITSPDIPHHNELPHDMEYPLRSPTSVLSYSAGSSHARRMGSQQFSKPIHVTKPRVRRRHSSVETLPIDMVEQDDNASIPSRPHSSASNTREIASNGLNRHKSYYEAVNNHSLTSQAIFSHPSERIHTLLEETPSSTDSTQSSTFFTDHMVCANSINLEMMSQSQDDPYYPSHDHQQSRLDKGFSNDVYHDCPQSDSELVTSSPRNYPRRRTGGVQASTQMNKQLEATHPRLLNSTTPTSPLQISQRSSPKQQHHSLEHPIQHNSPQHNRHRSFTYDANHIHQAYNR